MTKRKILAVTGARSEYDLMYPIYKILHEDDRFDFSIVITGPHLSERFGLTAKHVVSDGFHIADKIYNLVESNEKIARVISIGNQIPALAQVLDRVKPDIVLVAGDREESISTTMTSAFMDIPVAHFFGGDVAKDGNIDNAVRYAASKFAHIHFPTLENHRQVLIQLGEDDWRIFVVGNPALDRLKMLPVLAATDIAKNIGVESLPDRYMVLIQHSIITEFEKQAEHIRMTLDAIVSSGVFCFINYPNSDPGNAAIIDAYREYVVKWPNQFKLFQNLDRITFHSLLSNASCMLGNSSSGLLEAPSYGLAAINIGNRQRGRLHGDNVIYVDNNVAQIKEAITHAFNDTNFKEKVAKKNNPYGDGRTAEKVVEILSRIELGDALVHKNITYSF